MCLQEVAQQAEGYDAADLRVLVDRALHAAARRQLAAPLPGPLPGPATGQLAGRGGRLRVSAADLADARHGFQPAAAWGVGQLQVSSTSGCSHHAPGHGLGKTVSESSRARGSNAGLASSYSLG